MRLETFYLEQARQAVKPIIFEEVISCQARPDGLINVNLNRCKFSEVNVVFAGGVDILLHWNSII